MPSSSSPGQGRKITIPTPRPSERVNRNSGGRNVDRPGKVWIEVLEMPHFMGLGGLGRDRVILDVICMRRPASWIGGVEGLQWHRPTNEELIIVRQRK